MRPEASLTLATAALLFLVVIVPVIFLFLISFWHYSNYEMAPALTLVNYVHLLESDAYFSLLLQSTAVAFAAAAIATVVGGTAAYAILRVRTSLRVPVLILITAPFLVGEVLRLVGLRGLLDPASELASKIKWAGYTYPSWLMFSDQATALGIIQSWITVPVILCFGSFRSTFGRYDATATSLGAAPSQVALRILFPLNLPAIAVSFVVVFIAGLTSPLPADALGGARGANLPSGLATVIKDTANWPFGGVLSLLLLSMSVGSAYALLKLFGRWVR